MSSDAVNTAPSERENVALLYKAVFMALVFAFALLYRVGTSDFVSASGVGLFMLLGAVIGLMVLGVRESRHQPFSSFSIAAILWMLGYVYRGVVISTTTGSLDHYWGTPEAHLTEAAVLAILAYLFFVIGYRSRVGPALARWVPYLAFPSWSKTSDSKLLFKLYLLYSAGWVGRLLQFSYGIFHRQQETLLDISLKSWVNMIAQMAIFSIWAIMAVKARRGDRFVTFIPWFIVEFIYGLVEGGRTTMGRAVLIYWFAKSLYGKRPIKWINVILVLSISFIGVFPFFSVIRTSYYKTTDEHGRQGVNTALTSVQRWDETFEASDFSALQRGIYLRFAYIDPLLVVIDRVPSMYPFQNGDTFVWHSIAAPVPRVFWRNKPVFDAGRQWAILFGDDPNKEDLGSYGYVGTIGEAFFNFGYYGVFVLLLIGIWVRLHWSRYQRYKGVDPVSAIRVPYLWVTASPVVHLSGLFGGFWRGFFDMYFFTILIFGIPRVVTHRSGLLKPDED